MSTSRRIEILIWPLIFCLVLLLILGSLPAGTQAQGGSLPTPTNIGGGGDGEEDEDGTPVPPPAGISGFVYDYSNFAYQGGVTVVVDGGGWQAEAVTDSNGYYQIGNLGFGQGLVNLRLPPGTQPVVFDWPVRLVSGADLEVNLGYYWGDEAPLPVKLTANWVENRLVIAVENQTQEVASKGQLEILPPSQVKVSPKVTFSQGEVLSYDPYQFQVDAGEIEAGETATFEVSLEPVAEAGSTEPEMDSIRIIFTYKQQITPQMIEVALNEAALAEAEAEPLASMEQVEDTAVADSSEQPVSPAVSPDSEQEEVAAPVSTPTAVSAVESEESSPVQPSPVATTDAPLPVSGTSNLEDSGSQPQLFLALLLVLSLGVVGWLSLRPKT